MSRIRMATRKRFQYESRASREAAKGCSPAACPALAEGAQAVGGSAENGQAPVGAKGKRRTQCTLFSSGCPGLISIPHLHRFSQNGIAKKPLAETPIETFYCELSKNFRGPMYPLRRCLLLTRSLHHVLTLFVVCGTVAQNAPARAQSATALAVVRVDATPTHILNSFDPDRSLGSS